MPGAHRRIAGLAVLAAGFAGIVAAAERDSLTAAAARGDLATVNAMLKAGAGADDVSRGVTPLFEAARRDDLEVVRALFAAGADPNKPAAGRSVLLTVAQSPDVALIQAFADAKADLNVRDLFTGRTPLMLAMAAGHMDVARALISAGADVHVVTKYGVSALILVAGNPRPESVAIVKLLLAAHVNVNAGYPPIQPGGEGGAIGSQDGGDSALGRAAATGSVEAVQVLLAAGAEVNVRQHDWNTPLISAASRGRAEVVRLLLDAKADMTAEDAGGKTALALAMQNGHQDVAELLKAAAERLP